MKLRELLDQIKSAQSEANASDIVICGGLPRDKYLGRLKNIEDVDFTTGDKSIDKIYDKLIQSLNKYYEIKTKIAQDGHRTIYMGKLKLDFSSNFNTPNIDSILSKMGINNPTSMQKEIFSRDFTCNALLLDLDLKTISDPTHRGIKHIDNKIIKTCLAPEITLTTSKNRVIRSIYLAVKLDFTIDDGIINFVKSKPESIKIATLKALNEKLNEAFRTDPDKASYFITKMNLWNYIPINEKIYPYYEKFKK